MIFAIISDIHSNLEAITAVIEKCVSMEVEKYICLGDLVGYNANPSECINLIKSLPLHMIVKGNHDEYVGTDCSIEGINKYAKESIKWTRLQINYDNRKWLTENKLKIVSMKDGITIVHATLDSPEAWNYIFDAKHALANFSYQMTQFCFFGHSHIPGLFVKDPKVVDSTQGVMRIIEWEIIPPNEEMFTFKPEKGKKYMINPGSIGQPRNGDPRASFVIMDTKKNTISRICVKYDIELAQQKIYDAFLPESLGIRLASGR
ncbi:MAG TPA: metallophosphoesterase [Lentisphaeria bacterium]|nr:MAG: hypothetical protein A2X47_03640 [Lentisphaerae bacterium GWF2_38_69]HBM15228.1 metallophosphoesterase [Lentisphaeria bacterium]